MKKIQAFILTLCLLASSGCLNTGTSDLDLTQGGLYGFLAVLAQSSTSLTYVGVGDSGASRDLMYATDSNPYTWIQDLALAQSLNSFLDVTYGNGIFVGVTNANGQSFWSPDGKNWATVANGGTLTMAHIAYGNGVFVAGAAGVGGAGHIQVTSDGKSWTSTSLSDTTGFNGITFYNNEFWIVQGTTPKIYHSADGLTWTQATPVFTPAWITLTPSALNSGSGGLSLSNSTNNVLYTSTDGINWTGSAVTGEAAFRSNGAAYVGSGTANWVVVGATGTNSQVQLLQADGSWNLPTTPPTVTGRIFNDVIYDGTNVILVGNDGGGAAEGWISTDQGNNWLKLTVPGYTNLKSITVSQ